MHKRTYSNLTFTKDGYESGFYQGGATLAGNVTNASGTITTEIPEAAELASVTTLHPSPVVDVTSACV